MPVWSFHLRHGSRGPLAAMCAATRILGRVSSSQWLDCARGFSEEDHEGLLSDVRPGPRPTSAGVAISRVKASVLQFAPAQALDTEQTGKAPCSVRVILCVSVRMAV